MPALGLSISVTMRAKVDFPQPVSPTTASVRPAAISNETPPTARSCRGADQKPRVTG